MQNWTKNEKTLSCKTLREVIFAISGMTEKELLNPESGDPFDISYLPEAANMIQEAIDNKEQITIVGDYDADGVCSTAILFILLKSLGITPTVRIPKRMTEGYGISPKIVEEIHSGLIITIDNGISAIEAINEAKKKGLKVVVIDHHLPGEELPNADIIVDPHVHNDGSFKDYCGGGLGLKLAQLFLQENDELMIKIYSLAAIATIADVMPLRGDNRYIVQRGLESLNDRVATKGLLSLIEGCEFTKISAQDVGFKLGPVINAMGRLYDDGARVACGCLAQDVKDVPELAAKLIKANDVRKEKVASIYGEIRKIIPEQSFSSPIVIHIPELHDGIVGIVAGKIAEEFKVPAFIFTGSGDVIKGSGRSGGDAHIKDLLDTVADLLDAYGGHAGAAGITLRKSNLQAFQDAIAANYEPSSENSGDIIYDAKIKPEQVVPAVGEFGNFAPFGEGCPQVVVRIDNINLINNRGSHYRFLGADQSHLKLNAEGFSMIGFGLADKFKAENNPLKVDVIGSLSMNESKYGSIPQVEIIDLKASV